MTEGSDLSEKTMLFVNGVAQSTLAEASWPAEDRAQPFQR